MKVNNNHWESSTATSKGPEHQRVDDATADSTDGSNDSLSIQLINASVLQYIPPDYWEEVHFIGLALSLSRTSPSL